MGKIDLKRDLMPKIILEYRLSLDSVAELLNMSNEEAFTTFTNISKNKIINKAIQYVFNVETVNDSLEKQKEAKRKTYMFFSKIHTAKTKEELINIFNSLNDNIDDIKGKNSRYLSEKEIERVLKYRLKYALTFRQMLEIFGYGDHFMTDNTNKLKNEELKNKLEKLNEYNCEQNYNQKFGNKRK